MWNVTKGVTLENKEGGHTHSYMINKGRGNRSFRLRFTAANMVTPHLGTRPMQDHFFY